MEVDPISGSTDEEIARPFDICILLSKMSARTAILYYIEFRQVFLYITQNRLPICEVYCHMYCIALSIVNHLLLAFVKLKDLFYEQFVK